MWPRSVDVAEISRCGLFGLIDYHYCTSMNGPKDTGYSHPGIPDL